MNTNAAMDGEMFCALERLSTCINAQNEIIKIESEIRAGLDNIIGVSEEDGSYTVEICKSVGMVSEDLTVLERKLSDLRGYTDAIRGNVKYISNYLESLEKTMDSANRFIGYINRRLSETGYLVH